MIQTSDYAPPPAEPRLSPFWSPQLRNILLVVLKTTCNHFIYSKNILQYTDRPKKEEKLVLREKLKWKTQNY